MLLTPPPGRCRGRLRDPPGLPRAAAARPSASFVRAASLLKSDRAISQPPWSLSPEVTDDRVSGRHPFLVIFGVTIATRARKHEMLGDDERQPGPFRSGARKGSASRLRPPSVPDQPRPRKGPTSRHIQARQGLPPRSRLVGRKALLERLSACPPGGVALVCGPAGSGKTVLLRSWVDAAALGGDRLDSGRARRAGRAALLALGDRRARRCERRRGSCGADRAHAGLPRRGGGRAAARTSDRSRNRSCW